MVYVLICHYDWGNCAEYSLEGVYSTLEKANKEMMSLFNDDLINLEIDDSFIQDVGKKYAYITERHDFRYINYDIYEKEIL